MSVLCPYCEGQGSVYRARLKADNTIIYLCEECETVWLDDALAAEQVTNFHRLMQQKQLKADWSQLTDIEAL